MILDRGIFRDVKTALLKIEGHPGSAKLSEALARGLGFPDHHAIKQYFDERDGELIWSPETAALDLHTFIAFLGDSSISRDMAATAAFLLEGASFLLDVKELTEISGAKIVLPGLLPDTWQEKASLIINEYIRSDDLIYVLAPYSVMWEAMPGEENTSMWEFAVKEGPRPRELTDEDWRFLEHVESHGVPALNLLLQSAFSRIKSDIRQDCRDLFCCLRADRTGLYADFVGWSPNISIQLVRCASRSG